MSVHYKFKSTLDYDTVSFDGLHISVADLKKAIFHQKRIGKNTDFDLQITNAQTKEDYTDDNALIAKNTSLIIARVPLTIQQKRSWDRNEGPAVGSSKEEGNLGRSVDLTRLDGSEEDKIRAMMTQSTQDYDPSNYMKIRGANQTGDVPPNYRCYKCHQAGHWIKNCPLGTNQEPIEIKKSTGIPRSFMVPVEGPLVPGAMMTPTGQYAVPAIDHQAYKEGKKERPPFSQEPEPVAEKLEIPEDLLCTICKDLLTDAVMIPCCGNSFCDECIRTVLLESEEHECPDCNEKDVSPETLIPNRFLRNAVSNFKNETGYAKRQSYRSAMQRAQAVILSDQLKTENQAAAAAAPPPPPTLAPPQTQAPQIQMQENNQTLQTEIVEPPTNLDGLPQDFDLHRPPPVASVLPESTSESDLQSDSVTKLTTDEETEVPPPPGTEPLLPIPAIGSSPEKEREKRQEPPVIDREERREDYREQRHSREQRRSFSRDSHRDRSNERGRRIENLRTLGTSRRRSLSPRRSQRSEYPQQSGPPSHMANHPMSKNYQRPPPGEGHYPPPMQYDPGIRRSTEDRPGTPTVDEPHLHGPPTSTQPPLLPFPPGEDRVPAPNYNQPPPNMAPHNPPLLPDPYMGHRMPIYSHQQEPHYGPPRYERPPYQAPGYRPPQPPRGYTGPTRPLRGMHHVGYRGIQPPPPGLGRNIHNGNQPNVIDDPLEAFERMLREKDERDRRLGKHRRRSRSRSRTRSYSRSRSRSFGRRSPLPPRISRSRSPPLKRRSSRSPLPLRPRSRTPKRRSRSRSFSISRSRSYSRSQSPRGSLPRDRDRDRERDRERERERERERDRERDRDRDRDLPPRYRSPVRSPPRFQRERERERPRSREPRDSYNSYYNDSPANDYQFRDRDREPPPRERPPPRYPARNPPPQHNIPPLLPHLGAGSHPPPLMSLGPPPLDRKDYYDSYNRYAGPPPQRFTSPNREPPPKRFDDVAPPGTEGYYDLPPPGVDHPERPIKEDRERIRLSREREEREHVTKEQDPEERERLPMRDDRIREREERVRDRDERERRVPEREREDREKVVLPRDREERGGREKDERDRREREREREREERHPRERRGGEEERIVEKRDYDKERYREDRDRYRVEDKNRGRERDRRDRDYEPDRERHERYDRHSVDRKRLRKSQSPIRPKSRTEVKDQTPEKGKRKEKDHEDKDKDKDKVDDKKKEKKIKDKKKKKDADEKEKKKKKKKEKKAALKEAAKDEAHKVNDTEIVPTVEEKVEVVTMKKSENLEIEKVVPDKVCQEEVSVLVVNQEFEKKSLAINPEPPEFNQGTPECLEEQEFGANPPNPNFKPIPELKSEDQTVDSLYGGLDDTEIKTTVTEKYSLPVEAETETQEQVEVEKSPKKDEFLAPVPELSKWERDETAERSDSVPESPQDKAGTDEPKSTKVVTSEVLKRAENAIFQKAINAIRPIEIKKISESRKILYQNPEPKILEPEPARKSVNVTINVGRNERNVEITEPLKKAKLDRSKFKPVPESHSPTRLSAKERLGDKVEDDKERKIIPVKGFLDRHETKPENSSRSRSPRMGRDRRISPLMERRIDPPPNISNPERKVFLDERKRDRDRNDRPRDRNESRNDRHESRSERNESRGDREPRTDRGDFRMSRNDTRNEPRLDSRNDPRNESRNERNDRDRDRDRKTRTPPIAYKREDPAKLNFAKRKEEHEDDKKKDKKVKEDRKRKKEHRSRSKSKDRKKRKDKKHKKDKEKVQDKKQKHKDESVVKEKSLTVAVKPLFENVAGPPPTEVKKQRKNPRLVSDRKRSVLDEASFEPDYSATDSESDGEDNKAAHTAMKKIKPDAPEPQKELEIKTIKKRVRSTSTEDDTSTSESSSSDTESSDESPKRKKRKHKKHKKRKSVKKETTSDSDTNSDSSDSSSEEDKHKKKSKKSKSKNKLAKKKKKTKHK